MSDIVELYIKDCVIHRTEPYYGFIKGAHQGIIDCDLDFVSTDDIRRMAFAMNVNNSHLLGSPISESSKKIHSSASMTKYTAPVGNTSLTFLRLCRGVHRDKQHPPVNSSQTVSYRKLLATYGTRSSMYSSDNGSIVACKRDNVYASDGAGGECSPSHNTVRTHSTEPYISPPPMGKGVVQKLISGIVCAIKINSLTLQEIHLININLDSDCVKKLCYAALPFCQSLRVLDLSNNPKIGDIGALALSINGCLAAMPCLKNVSLKMCDLTWASGRAISGIVASNREKEFSKNFKTSLRGKKMNNQSDTERCNTGITHIDLSQNYICGDAIVELMKALEAGDVSVEFINLRQNLLSRKDVNVVASFFSKIVRVSPSRHRGKCNFVGKSRTSPLSFIDISDNIGLEECRLEDMLNTGDIEKIGEGILVVRRGEITSPILSNLGTINNTPGDIQKPEFPVVSVRSSSAPSRHRQSYTSPISADREDQTTYRGEMSNKLEHHKDTPSGQCKQHLHHTHHPFLCFPTHCPCVPGTAEHPLGIYMPSNHYSPYWYSQPPLQPPLQHYYQHNDLLAARALSSDTNQPKMYPVSPCGIEDTHVISSAIDEGLSVNFRNLDEQLSIVEPHALDDEAINLNELLQKPDEVCQEILIDNTDDREIESNEQVVENGNKRTNLNAITMEDILARTEIGEVEKAVAIEGLRHEVSAHDQRLDSLNRIISQHAEILSKVQVAEKRLKMNERKNAAGLPPTVVNKQIIINDEPRNDQDVMLSHLTFNMAKLITRGLDQIEGEMCPKKETGIGSNLTKPKSTALGKVPTLSSIESTSSERTRGANKVGGEGRVISFEDEVTSLIDELGW